MHLRTLLLSLLALGSGFWAPASAAQQPNILFIAVDDLRPEINCFGADHIVSPNLDKLASTGTAFLNAHCQQAVCSPSRSSLMTGLRPDSTKVWNLTTHFRKAVPDVVTLPQHFIAQGYHAVSMGKIYHGSLDDAPSWSEKPLKAKNASRNALPENLELIAKKRQAAKEKGLTGKSLSRAARGPATESADVPDEKYTDGAIALLAAKTLGELKKKDQPFFLAVGFSNPHLPFNSPKKYWDLYDREKISLAPNRFHPKNAYEGALSSSGEIRVYEGIPAKGSIPDDQALELRHGYYAAVSFIDACIGKILAELDRLELAEDTIVVVWGDHGWKLGEHDEWCKHSNVHLDTNSPLIIRAPGQKSKGTPSKALTEFVDIYPTLCDLAGLDKPSHLEGDSLAPLLNKPNRPWKRAAFSQYPRNRKMGYSISTGDYRYTVWVDQKKDNEVVFTELYDHTKDPQENENVFNDPAYAPIIKKLAAIHKAGWQGTRKALHK